ncbi:MAG: hypothetical protein AB7O97_10215 [Planctomycetota bacterium]
MHRPLLLLACHLLPALSPAQTPPSGKPSSPQAPQYPELLAVDDRSRIARPVGEGVICFALYTVQDEVLKLSAHLYPLRPDEPTTVTLEVAHEGGWRAVEAAETERTGWTAVFRVPLWGSHHTTRYRLRHAGGDTFEGVVRKDPVTEDVITAAVLSCNSPGPGGGDLPKDDVAAALRAIDPDVLLFVGDQVYPHTTHTAAWLEFGRIFRDVMRDRPTVCMPDDHDVGQPNLWGQGGRHTDRDSKGGYTRPAGYVQMVERQQTSHLPDPVDPTPIEQGIRPWFTRLVVGGIDFALIEDRKWKSGCYGLVTEAMGPRPDHVTEPGVDPAQFDLPDKQLLGERQERWLAQWAEDWDGAAMKVAVSQTVWSMASTYDSKDRTFYYCDFDSNGWPQHARDHAVRLLRRCAALHLCGDQHLATIVQYGTEDWRDSGYAFCVPAIANLWPRWWAPKTAPQNAEPGAREHCGDALDGFGNKLTVYAHTNPRATGREPAALHDRMPGFGVVRFDKRTHRATLECWPRMVDPTVEGARQYEGWPRTVAQLDNLGVQPFHLPELVLQGAIAPLVRVTTAAGDPVCTVRLATDRAILPVPTDGPHTVAVWHEGGWLRREGVVPVPRGARAAPVVIELP